MIRLFPFTRSVINALLLPTILINNLLNSTRIGILTLSFLLHNYAHASTIIPGNQPNPSFSFPLFAHASSGAKKNLYVAAHTIGAKEYSIASFATTHGQEFVSLTPETITLNNTPNQKNPLYNTPITALSVLETNGLMESAEHLVAVSAQEPATLYFLEHPTHPDMLSINNIPDATGKPTSGILNIATAPYQGLIFAAVKPSATENVNTSFFGAPGSGIALTLFKNSATPHTFTILNPQAVPLDTNTRALRISTGTFPLSIDNNYITMHWNATLERLFIGLQVTGSARALVVARIDKEKNAFAYELIAPDTVFDTTHNALVGALQGSTSLHEITSITTSTSRTYLIIRGGNGTPEATQNSIYALPLVMRNQHEELIGMIADNTTDRTSIPATTPDTMTNDTTPAALIGGGPVPIGTATEIKTSGDTIFVATTDGLFYSQALFDHTGKIKRWTDWQRYAGITNHIDGLIINNNTSTVTSFANTTDNTSALVTRTQWSTGSTQKSNALLAALGPVEQIIDFPISTPGLESISIMATVYNDTLSLAQTGTITNALSSVPEPTLGAIHHTQFTQGTITQNLVFEGNPTVLTISGGALSTISPLTQIAIGQSDTTGSGWIFCGGDNGLAILSTPDNNGWTSLETGFEGLTAGMSFKKIGDYTYIKKVIIEGSFLYILTDTVLDRIALDTLQLDPTHITPTRLATHNQEPFNYPHSFFNDLIVSDKLALLATKNGLYRVGNGQDITHANSSQEINWTLIPLINNYAGPVTKLVAKSSTGRSQDCAKETSDGHIYVLCANRSTNKAQLNRFAIAPVQIDGITDQTIRPIPDFFKTLHKKIPSYYINFGEFRDLFVTDGALNFHARGQENAIPTNVHLMPSILVPTGIQAGHNIPSMVQNSALGTWLVGNEKGIHVNE